LLGPSRCTGTGLLCISHPKRGCQEGHLWSPISRWASRHSHSRFFWGCELLSWNLYRGVAASSSFKLVHSEGSRRTQLHNWQPTSHFLKVLSCISPSASGRCDWNRLGSPSTWLVAP
jgi:hypothetical protein